MCTLMTAIITNHESERWGESGLEHEFCHYSLHALYTYGNVEKNYISRQ